MSQFQVHLYALMECKCSSCNGYGKKTETVSCPHCKGTGYDLDAPLLNLATRIKSSGIWLDRARLDKLPAQSIKEDKPGEVG